MYREFFGLTALPFNNTPDPRFFFNTPDHEEALASLLYAAQQRKGFVLVTGEVGSGKTLLSRLLLSHLDASVRTAVITNTRLTGAELLAAICREFGLDVEDEASATEASRMLEEFLLEQYARDRLAVVVLDEAQNLPMESFEELRMLGNLEADDAKLLQVLILGQPELQESFRRASMRQLYQRIFRTFHLGTLTREQSFGYIEHRLKVAGLRDGERIFDQSGLEAVYHHAEGIPRLINQICDNAMLTAYTQSTRTITGSIVNEVIEQMMALAPKDQDLSPQGIFARQQLGTGPARSSDAPAYPPKQALPPAAAAELESIRQAREQAMEMLSRVTQAAESAEKRAQAENTQRTNQSRETLAAHQARQKAGELLEHAQSESADSHTRLKEIIGEAHETADGVELRAAKMLRETQQHNAEIQEQVKQLLREVRKQQEANQQAAAKLVADTEATLAQARRELQEANAQIKNRAINADRRSLRMIESVREQVQTLRSQFESLQQNVDTRADEVNTTMETLSRDMNNRVESSYNQLKGIVNTVQKDFQTAQTNLKDTKDKILAEAEQHRTQANAILKQTQDLLMQTREQSASMLASFRAQMAEHTEQTERLWKDAAAEGAKTLNELQVDLTRTRLLAKRSRTDLESLIREVKTELSSTKNSFEETCDSHRAEFNRFMEQANVIKSDIAVQFENSKHNVEQFIEEQQRVLRDRFSEIRKETSNALNTADANANHIFNNLQGKLKDSSEQAERIRLELQKAVTELQQNAIDCHVRYENETAHMRREMKDVLDRDRHVLDETRHQLNEMTQQAMAATDELAERLEHIKASANDETAARLEDMQRQTEAAITQATQAVQDLDGKLNNASETHEQLRSEFDSMIQSANDDLNGLRGAFDNDLNAYREQAASFSEDGQTIRQEMTRRFVEARKELDEAVENHRSDWLNRVSQIISQTDGLISSSEQKADETVKALQEQLDAAAEAATAQFNDVVENRRQEWQQMVGQIEVRTSELIAASESNAEETLESLREQVDAITSETEERFTIMRGSFAKAFESSSAKVAELSQEAAEVTCRVAEQFEAARAAFATAAEEQHRTMETEASQLNSRSAEVLESTKKSAEDTLSVLRAEVSTQLDTFSTAASRIQGELSSSLDEMAKRAASCRDEYSAEVSQMEQDLTSFTDHHRASFDSLQSHVESLLGQASSTLHDLTDKLSALRDSADTSISDAGHALSEQLNAAMLRAEALRADSDSLLENLARRQSELRTEAESALSDTDAALNTLRTQSESSLSDVRSALIQMTERSATLQRDLTNLSDEVRAVSQRSMEQLQNTASGVVEHIKALREAFREEASSSFAKLRELGSHVDESAEAIQASSQRLLEEAHEGAEKLRAHANELLAQAQNGSDKLGRQASELLMQAHTSAERFREQAEALLRRAEATAETIQREAESLRSDVLKESAEVRQRVAAAQKEFGETREAGEKELAAARELHTEAAEEARSMTDEAAERAEAFLARAEEVQRRSEALLAMPRQLVAEAENRAAALSQMSEGVTSIVEELSSLSDSARADREDLHSATSEANAMLSQLKQHTARVGQLVGIIRQVYGSMDARLEKLRDRLMRADDLCRSVPQEITSLREALGGELAGVEDAWMPDGGRTNLRGGSSRSADSTSSTQNAAALPPAKPGKSRLAEGNVGTAPKATTLSERGTGSSVVKRGQGNRAGSLGEIVQRNTKLNQWLHEMLGEEDLAEAKDTQTTNTK